MTKKPRTALALVLIALLAGAFACWKIWPYIPFFPHDVNLPSVEFWRSPHVYTMDPVDAVSPQADLAPEWERLTIDRKAGVAVFESAAGERISAALGKAYRVTACEGQFDVEVLPLEGALTLGSLTFRQPALVTVCEMWAAGEKLRPARVVLWEGPVADDRRYMFGMQCEPDKLLCMSFAQVLGELAATVVDKGTGAALPEARIVLNSGMGAREYTGGFRIPLYVALQASYQVTAAGYISKTGEIENFYGYKLSIMYYTPEEAASGRGMMIELAEDGRTVEYAFELEQE